MQSDIANAFNNIARQNFINALQDPALKPLLPLVKLTYRKPSLLFLDASFNCAPLRSEREVRQGDPLGPLLFTAGIHPALRATVAAHLEVLCLAYADDVTFLFEGNDTAAAFAHFIDRMAHLGLRHNPGICAAAWSLDRGTVEGILPPGVPVRDNGIRLLGTYLGSSASTTSFLSEQLKDMAKPLPLLEQTDPHVASLPSSPGYKTYMSYLVL
ncbi:unnamed protein product [Closterium sp. NIES-54]